MVIAITNRKGGVGKSATAHALGAGLTLKGYKVLFIDLDPQRNLTFTTGANPEAPITMTNILYQQKDIREAIQATPTGDIAAASVSLATADVFLTQNGREYLLKEALKPITGNYDYIIIDTPPALGTLTINALVAADRVIIPTQHDFYGVLAITDLVGTMQSIKRQANPALTIDGILLTRKKPRATLANDVLGILQDTAKVLETKVYTAIIRDSIGIMEAGGQKQSIYEYAPKGNGAADYKAFVEEFLKGDK